MSHAKLSPSSSHRWIACPPSAALNAEIPDEGSDYAKQGTDAHSLCEFKVEKALGREAPDPRENLDYYDEEMENATEEYRNFVLEKVAAAKSHCADPLVLIEQRLDFSRWVPDGFGTGDCIIVSDDLLQIIDFKYGLGVLVEAENNPQMMCYALGALDAFDGIYDIENVEMTIFQPRRENVSSATLSKADLLSWAEGTLKPAALLADRGEGEFHAGEHCRFCKVKATCRKRAEHNLALARYDFAPPPSLDDTEIEAVLGVADRLAEWANDVKEYALAEALRGKRYENFKAVEGRSTRKYSSDEAVAAAVEAAGLDPFEKKLLGITAMTRLLGKKKFDELLGGLVEKAKGKPTLVPRADKRKEITTSASEDFKEED